MNHDKPRIEGIIIPGTLARYGLDLAAFTAIGDRQGWVCGVCKKKPASGRLFIDHEHIRGWKRMVPAERALYVRGLACYVCNRFVLNYRVSAWLLRAAAEYLEAYEARRGGG